MQYAKKLHELLLPYYNEYKKAVDELTAIKNEDVISDDPDAVHAETVKIKSAQIKADAMRKQLIDAIENTHDSLKSSFCDELSDKYAYDLNVIDKSIFEVLDSDDITTFDFIKLYKTASDTISKRIISERAGRYATNNRDKLENEEIKILEVIETDGKKFSPYIALKSFDSVYNAYRSFANATIENNGEPVCEIIIKLPEYARRIGLEM